MAGNKAKSNHEPGSASRWGGTEAPSRPNLEVANNPPSGAGEPIPSLSKGSSHVNTSPAPLKTKLALEGSRADTLTGGDGLGDPGERGAQGGQKSGAPLSTSCLIALLADHREACRDAKAAIEKIILKLHVEDRMDLAHALCKLNHVLRGGVL